jgi:hypothetical protein
MKAIRCFALCIVAIGFLAADHTLHGQAIVINEVVEDEQDFETTDISPDTREFVELYNSGTTPIDLAGWTLAFYDLALGLDLTEDVVPSGTVAPGGFFVIGGSAVPNVNYSPKDTDLWPNGAGIFQLKNPSGTLIDAVGLETFRGTELAMATQAQLDQIGAGETVGPDAKGGWWGQIESNNAHPSDATYPNQPMSLGRYRDGRDNNINGRDFGMIPVTPGQSNNLTQAESHVIPDVNATAVGTALHDNYYASFKLPRVIAPGTVSGINPNAITPSPQGGNAIIAWDETGGGNAVYSDSYVNKFQLYAYIDPRPFNVTAADTTQSEATIYGIGSTDVLFATPNSADLLTGQPGTGGNITSSANGSTGLGWLIQRRTSNAAGTQNSAAVLQLVDFNDGGDGVLADNDWQIKGTVDLTGMNAGWHVLSLEYDPATGSVTAKYDDQNFNFNTVTGLVGNFYVGYRENLPGTGSPIARPPTYDLFVAGPAGVAGDYNNNGAVDAADYVVWRENMGTNNTLPNNSLPGPIGQAHYDQWRANFGKSGGPGGLAAGVPEPSTVAIAVAFSLGALGWRRSAKPQAKW